MGSRNALSEFKDVVLMLEEKKFDSERLITSVYKMENVHEAFQY